MAVALPFRSLTAAAPKVLPAAALLLALSLAAGCNGSGEGGAGEGGESGNSAAAAARDKPGGRNPAIGSTGRPGTKVKVLTLAPQDFTIHTTYIGHLLPIERVTLRSEMEGMVERTDFDTGDAVAKGRVLVNISTRQLTLRRDLARSNHKLAEASYRRNVQLIEKELIPAAQLDVSRNERDVAKLNLELAELELRKSQVRSPIAGTVKSKSVRVGEYVSKGQELAEILDLSRLLAVIHVPEKEMRHVAPGKPASVTLDALPDNRFAGRVKTVGVEADLRNRSFEVEVELANTRGELRPGMLARVEIETGAYRQQLLIPRQAVLEREDRRIVFVAEDGRAVERTVETGVSRDGDVQVLSGLEPGQRLIVTGQHQVTPNSRIQVVAGADGSEAEPEP